MVELEHLSKEFEKVHDAFPGLIVRLAVMEHWQSSHLDTHRLEDLAVGAAKIATDLRLKEMNYMRRQIEAERGIYITRELYDREHQRIHDEINDLRTSRDTGAGAKGIVEKFWPLFLAALMFLVGHFWK
jgi:hypothetical protein